MKKLTILAVAALAISFASCKKDRTCTCTYTQTGSSSANTQVTTFTKVSKKAAAANCTSGTSYDSNYPGFPETRACKLS